MEKYESKAKTNVIKYTTRTSMKIGNSNNYYTFEYGEERSSWWPTRRSVKVV